MLKLLTCIALIVAPQVPLKQDGDWIRVDTSDTRDVWVNVKSIRRTAKPSEILGWIRFTRLDGSPVFVIRKRVDCANETIATLAVTAYDRKGEPEGSETYSEHQVNSEPVTPGTLNESAFKALCSLADTAPLR